MVCGSIFIETDKAKRYHTSSFVDRHSSFAFKVSFTIAPADSLENGLANTCNLLLFAQPDKHHPQRDQGGAGNFLGGVPFL